MEFLIAAFTAAFIIVVVVLIATGGRPMILVTSARESGAAVVRNRYPLLVSAVIVLLVVAFGYLFYIHPATGMGPEQPIPFSHRVHAGVKAIACEFCHPYVGRSNHPGLPPVEKCLYCHNHIIANHPWIQKEHQYFNSGTPVPWKKVFNLPEHVLFNHQRHIRNGIECQSCHGATETMDRLVGQRFKMGFCIECHNQKGANVGCWLSCHS